MYILQSQLELSRCPHCNVNSPSIHMISNFETKDFKNGNPRQWVCYKCSRCGGSILAAAPRFNEYITEMYPNALIVSNTIPERAKTYIEQAIESIHAPSGAIMLAASAIDSMLKNKGYIKDSLYSRINHAAKEHLITEEMSKWAHQVRLEANEQRHAEEELVLPTEADAKKTIDFTLALAEFLFVLPSKVAKGIEETKDISI
jgi:hypothetical protein